MARILVLCPYPQAVAAGQRLKYEQYLDDWREAGHDVVVSPFMDRALWDCIYLPGRTVPKLAGTLRGYFRRLRILATLGSFDLIYISMWVTPLGLSWTERYTRARSRRIIYDIEDNLLTDSGAPTGLRQLLKGRGKARYLLKRADHVIAASPFMIDRYRVLNDACSVTLIYPSIDTDRFTPGATASRSPKAVIGWTGTFSSAPYLDLLRPVFRKLAGRIDFKLLVIGNFPYTLSGVDLEVLAWSADEEVAQLRQINIGVYPLPDDDWVLGKAGLKNIQYMAIGIPSVSSNIGTATVIVDDGVDGLLVDTQREWVEALERLCNDAELRRRMGARAREKAVSRFSRAATRDQYLQVIAETLAR